MKFLQELCGLARHLQPNVRADLLNQLVHLGLFEVLTNLAPSLLLPVTEQDLLQVCIEVPMA